MLKPPVNKNDHIIGGHNAHVTLVEYGDYECPHCGRAFPITKRIQKEMGDQLRFVFRNFPIQEIHPHAFIAAVAAEAADRQNAFWPMHDLLFKNQDRLSGSDLMGYALALNLDIPRFRNDINDKALADKVEADFESGIRSGVNGTPTFFINGTRYNGSWEEPDLLKVLQEVQYH